MHAGSPIFVAMLFAAFHYFIATTACIVCVRVCVKEKKVTYLTDACVGID